MKSLFKGNPSVTIKFYSLSNVRQAINKLKIKVDNLEERIGKLYK